MEALKDRPLLPEHVGETRLRWFCDINAPRFRVRTRDIIIPCFDGVGVYPLQGGKHVLISITGAAFRPHRHIEAEGVECLTCAPSKMRRQSREARVWLAGEDEGQPFLSQLPSFFEWVLLNEGEATFYEKLRGAIIRALEARWGWERTKRQGDIFAYELPFTWDEFVRMERRARAAAGPYANWRKVKVEKKVVDTSSRHGFSVLRTRHCLVGEVWVLDEPIWSLGIKGLEIGLEGIDRREGFIASGTLTAPNHAPIELAGPHVTAQAMLLHRGFAGD